MSRATPEWLVVARRELEERVRTVWFAVVTVLGPLAMVGVMVIPAWLSMESAKEKAHIQLVDHSGALAEHFVTAGAALGIEVEVVPSDTDDETLMGRIRSEEIDGFLVLPADALEGGEGVYRGANAGSLGGLRPFYMMITAASMSARADELGIAAETVVALTTPIDIDVQHTTGRAEGASGVASFFVGYAVVFILYMAILLYGVSVLRSVVQEKTNRVVEIMASAIKPHALMLGKILGVGAVGLLQLSVWLGMALLTIHHREAVLGLFGISGGGFELPSLTLVDALVVVAYFLAGYFLYAALYAAIGAMVSSEQDAQQAQTPVILLLVIPMLCVQLIANDPRSGAAEVLTLIPLSAPVLMPMRYLMGGASPADLAISLALLVVTIALVVWLAARIFRVGILMYGKRPSLRELARWIRR